MHGMRWLGSNRIPGAYFFLSCFLPPHGRHYLDEGENFVGRKAKQNKVELKIALAGISIQDHHATIILKDGEVFLEAPNGASDDGVGLLLNGKPVTVSVQLRHFDRILFGTNHL